MIQELVQQGIALYFQYYIGIIIFFVIPFYGIYHKFDREYFVECMKDLWRNNKSITGPIGFVVSAPVIFMIYGYKTAWDRYWSFMRGSCV